ncbi:hypothetical protein WDU94_007030 [Cyamophila willieti]
MPEKEVFYPMHPPPPTGLSLNFPSAFATFHLPQAPIPVNQRTDDGRYIYGIHSAVSSGAFHPPTSSAHGKNNDEIIEAFPIVVDIIISGIDDFKQINLNQCSINAKRIVPNHS